MRAEVWRTSYDRLANRWDCSQCKGPTARPGLHEARGQCGGAFTCDLRGSYTVKGRVLLSPYSFAPVAEAWEKDTALTACPISYQYHSSIQMIFSAAIHLLQGGAVADVIPEPTAGALVCVNAVRAEFKSVEARYNRDSADEIERKARSRG